MAGQQVFVIDDFPGFYSGISKSRLPAGALVDWGEAKGDNRTLNVASTNEGELVPGANVSLAVTDSGFFNQMHGIFYWNPPTGGGRLVLAHKTQLGQGVIGPPVSDHVPPGEASYSYTWNYAISPPGWGAGESNSRRLGRFTPYGDRLYYCNGVDYPLVVLSSETFKVVPVGVHHGWNGDTIATITGYCRYVGIDESPNNTLQYYVTAVTVRGESPPFPVSTEPFDFTSVDTTIRVYPQFLFSLWSNEQYDDIVKLNLYRMLDGIPMYVTTIPRGRDSFVDSVPDSALGYPISQELGAPSNFRFMASFEDRMFAVGGYGNPNRVACSARGYPEQWPAINELVLPDVARNSLITDLREINGSLYVLFTDKIFRLRGSDPTNYVFDLVNAYVGVAATKSVAPWQDGVVFLSLDGLYFFNGYELRRISDPVQGLFTRQTPGVLGWSECCGAVAGDRYYLSYAEGDETAVSFTGENTNKHTKVLSVNLKNGRFGVQAAFPFYHSCPIPGNASMVIGNSDGLPAKGLVYMLSPDYPAVDGINASLCGAFYENISMFMSDLDFGLPDTNKVVESVEVFLEAPVEPTVTVVVYRSYPLTDAGSFSESQTVTGVEPTDIAKWGASWVGKTYGLVHLRRVKAYFHQMQGKSFNISLEVGLSGQETRVQKVVIRYRVEDPNWRGSGVLV